MASSGSRLLVLRLQLLRQFLQLIEHPARQRTAGIQGCFKLDLELAQLLLESAEAAQWRRASFQCQEATLLIPHLSGNPHLLAEEVTDLREAGESLEKALRYINGRLARNQLDAGLNNPHAANLGATIQKVSIILSRLRNLSMEVPHAG
jgi:hypothetical protein